jgi:hypothetical protein
LSYDRSPKNSTLSRKTARSAHFTTFCLIFGEQKLKKQHKKAIFSLHDTKTPDRECFTSRVFGQTEKITSISY